MAQNSVKSEQTDTVETTLIGGVDQLTINKWKKQYGKLKLVTLENADGVPTYFWFRKPDAKAFSAFVRVAKNDEFAGLQLLFRNCLLNQELVHLADDTEVVISVGEHLSALVKKRPATSQDF